MTCARRRSTICSTTACSFDPLVHGVWPPELLALLEQHQVTWETSEEDLAVIREHTVDELGINLYYPHRSKPRRGPGIRTPRSIRPGIMSRLSCPAGG
ncbi:beta-glucosidase [Klebsiella pneumoniae subsp. ozaenae]|uniref:Beta-glucosidase n=1 Tax=Klebsiella pneumoniae subsp. ozaenae TaxID=574 RepID=A0A378AKL1_KLEPO|nr:beta-glucosidase [Klebsiella pneumoniae subsp. ozaenae]